MLGQLRQRFTAKKERFAEETQERIRQYATLERQAALQDMKQKHESQTLLNQAVSEYLTTVHPSFLLHPDVHRAVLNMLFARSEGTFSMSISMTKEMRKAYSFYHNDLKPFIVALEERGFRLNGNEELFLTSLLTKLRETNYRMLSERYGDFISIEMSLSDAFYRYFVVVPRESRFESGHLDFFATYLNHKKIEDFTWTKNKMKRQLRQFAKQHKHLSRKTSDQQLAKLG
ncbi:hypothetical protein FLK61_36280 [Paenalkalicoccus suaedae]|uniref:Uncharacterized protein n=1 Tax=Paenalkalicoccus suaedae TaxID=2592382 RepID=A0A859FGG4_9BACI|nr:hypothetical protein [Paenalkalicoccus suaedae]QKS72121.1 hypothetical protein FLK61_36280 [Paenalkalicoccus suaedae]